MTAVAVEQETRTRVEPPRVNLLPPEIAEAAKFRSLRALLFAVVVAVVALVGFLWYQASSSKEDAEDQLAAAQAQGADLQTEIVRYANVPKTQAAVVLAESALESAMGQEVRYSFVLSDLSLSVADGVWLDNFVVAQNVDAGQPAVGTFGTNGVATVTMTGHALDYRNVANWLHTLEQADDYADASLTEAKVADPIDGQDNVTFSSGTVLTPEAYSHRYDSKAGN